MCVYLRNTSRSCYLERMVVLARSGLPEPCLCCTGTCWVRSPEALKMSVVEIRNTGILKWIFSKTGVLNFMGYSHSKV